MTDPDPNFLLHKLNYFDLLRPIKYLQIKPLHPRFAEKRFVLGKNKKTITKYSVPCYTIYEHLAVTQSHRVVTLMSRVKYCRCSKSIYKQVQKNMSNGFP